MDRSRDILADSDALSARIQHDRRAEGVPWDKVTTLRWPLSAYYADLKARQYIRAFVRAGASEGERMKRGEVIDRWLVEKRVSSVEVVSAIKRVKADR